MALLLRASASAASASATAASAAAYFAKVSHAVRPPSPPALSVVLFARLHLLFTFAFSSMSFLFDFWSLPAKEFCYTGVGVGGVFALLLSHFLCFFFFFFLFLFCVFLTAGSALLAPVETGFVSEISA